MRTIVSPLVNQTEFQIQLGEYAAKAVRHAKIITKILASLVLLEGI